MGDFSTEAELSDEQGLNSKSLGSFELTDKQKAQLEKAIEKQKDFLAGKIKKTKLSKANKSKIKAFENSEADIKNTGKDIGVNTLKTYSQNEILIKLQYYLNYLLDKISGNY